MPEWITDNWLPLTWLITGVLGSLLRLTGKPALIAAGSKLESIGCDLPKLAPQRKPSGGATTMLATLGFVTLGLVAVSELGCAALGGDAQRADETVAAFCAIAPAQLSIVQTIAEEHSVPVDALVEVVCAGQRMGASVQIDREALLEAHRDMVAALGRLKDGGPEPAPADTGGPAAAGSGG